MDLFDKILYIMILMEYVLIITYLMNECGEKGFLLALSFSILIGIAAYRSMK